MVKSPCPRKLIAEKIKPHAAHFGGWSGSLAANVGIIDVSDEYVGDIAKHRLQPYALSGHGPIVSKSNSAAWARLSYAAAKRACELRAQRSVAPNAAMRDDRARSRRKFGSDGWAMPALL
jgi:hypothetical protein